MTFPYKRFQSLFLAIGMLSTGTINTVAKKVSYQTKVKNSNEYRVYFSKPWFSTLVMFIGESLCLLIYAIQLLIARFRKRKAPKVEIVVPEIHNHQMLNSHEERLNDTDYPEPKAPKLDPTGGMGHSKFLLMACLLCSCDLVATTLTGIGLLYCPASIVQILRGFVMVFVMLFAFIFLKRKPSRWEILGVGFSICGLACVGVSAVLGDGTSKNGILMAIGIALCLLAQVFSAIQFVFEEKFMKGYDIPPLYLVGFEGIFGALMTAGICFPVVWAIPGRDDGSYENFVGTVYMVFTSNQVLLLQVLIFVSIAFFNWISLTMSKVLSSTHRTLIDAMRTIFVWLVMVVVYYCTYKTPRTYGEPVTLYSLLEATGFLFMIFGTVIHNNVNGFGEKIMCVKKKPVAPETLPIVDHVKPKTS